MRIIAGAWRGRILQAPKGDHTRPTSDRVREALFSMLVSRLGSFEDLRIADFFAGSGALGLEALSRGARTCIFVEQDHQALSALKANIENLQAKADIRAQSATALSALPEPLDLILMDPPYRTGAGLVALDRCARLGWVGPETLVSLETATEERVEISGFETIAERTHGKAKISLMRRVR